MSCYPAHGNVQSRITKGWRLPGLVAAGAAGRWHCRGSDAWPPRGQRRNRAPAGMLNEAWLRPAGGPVPQQA